MFASVVIGVVSGFISLLRNPSKRWGMAGILLNAFTALLASGQIEPNYYDRSMYAGLDYFILTLLISALVFIPMQRFYAKYKEQKLLRSGGVTDIKYFMFSHLGIQLLSFFTIIPAQILFNRWLNSSWHQMVSGQPLVLQFIEILIIVDFLVIGFIAVCIKSRLCSAFMPCIILRITCTSWRQVGCMCLS